MYHLIKSIYLQATSKEEYSILVLGLDNAGKTTLLEQIKAIYSTDGHHPNLKTVPTVGQNVSMIDLPDCYLRVWDVGGQHSLRGLWQSYYSSAHAIVFVVDSTDVGDADIEKLSKSNAQNDDEGRLGECKLVLEDVLQNQQTEGVPVLVLANKQDREDCVEVVRIKEGLVRKVFEGEKGSNVRDSRVLPLSALTGTGVKEAVEWLCSRVKWNKEGRPPVMRFQLIQSKDHHLPRSNTSQPLQVVRESTMGKRKADTDTQTDSPSNNTRLAKHRRDQATNGRLQSSKTTGFLDLPAEVRNKAYFDALLDAVHQHIDSRHPPALLRVSHQVRNEFKSIYCGGDYLAVEQITGNTPAGWQLVTNPTALEVVLTTEDVPLKNKGHVSVLYSPGLDEWLPLARPPWLSRAQSRSCWEQTRRLASLDDPYARRFAFLGRYMFGSILGLPARIVCKLTMDVRNFLDEMTTEEQFMARFASRFESINQRCIHANGVYSG